MKLCVETCSLGYVAIATNYADSLFWVSINSEAPKLFDEFFTTFPYLLNKIFAPPEPETIDKVLSIVNGGVSDNSLELSLDGTLFQRKVWAHISTIKSGTTQSYKDIAVAIGLPKAHRAVANACGKNQLAIIVPCHRVITSSGALGGYRWGVETKQKLLERENVGSKIAV
jgi:O-6-methylguanine DNA methyltransferase